MILRPKGFFWWAHLVYFLFQFLDSSLLNLPFKKLHHRLEDGDRRHGKLTWDLPVSVLIVSRVGVCRFLTEEVWIVMVVFVP